MADKTDRKTERTEEAPAEVSPDAVAHTDVAHDDVQARETQRQRNNDAVNQPPYSGDPEELKRAGVPAQLVDGRDPDATLID